jgi:hypothetical protein
MVITDHRDRQPFDGARSDALIQMLDRLSAHFGIEQHRHPARYLAVCVPLAVDSGVNAKVPSHTAAAKSGHYPSSAPSPSVKLQIIEPASHSFSRLHAMVQKSSIRAERSPTRRRFKAISIERV